MNPWALAALALPTLLAGTILFRPDLMLVPGLAAIVAAVGLWVVIAGLRISLEGLRASFALPGATMILLLVAALLISAVLPDIAQRSARAVVEQPFSIVNVLRAALIGLAGLVALGGYGLNTSGHAGAWRTLFAPPAVFYLVFAIVAVGSAAYASHALASLSKSVEILVMAFVMGALVHAVERSGEGALRHALGLWNLTVGLIAAILLALLALALADPATALQEVPGAFLPVRLVGAWLQIHPNTSGQLAAILVVVGLNRCLRVRDAGGTAFWFGIVALGLVVLVLAQARTSFIALMIAAPVVLQLNRRPILGALFGLVALLGASIQAQLLSDYLLRGQSVEQFMTGTGRSNIWQVAWTLFETSPFVGLGFYSSVRLDLTERYRLLDISNADNTVLEVLLGVGILGAIPFVLFLVSYVRRVLGALAPAPTRGLYVEVLATLIIIGMRLAFGPTVQLFSFTLVIVAVLAAFAVARVPLRT